MLRLRSSAGISLTSTLLLALAAQTQVVQMYYLFAIHPDTRDGMLIPKPIQPRAWLDLAQIVVQWICSVILFALVLTSSPILSGEPSTTSSNGRLSMSRRTALALLASHALVSLLFIFLAGESRRQLDNLPFLIIMSANESIAIPLSTLAILWAFYAQVQTPQPTAAPSALSRASLVLQTTTFLALAALWPFRSPSPRKMWPTQDPWYLPVEWFCVMGWACVNNGIAAFGQFGVLYATSTEGKEGSAQEAGERRALLAA